MRKLFTLLIACFITGAWGHAQISTFPDFEDFESEIQCPTGCGPTCNIISNSWKNADQWGFPQANIDWTSDRGGTGSFGTGPSVDHTLGTGTGTYLYMETSCNGTGYPNRTAELVSNFYDFTGGGGAGAKISFWYHAFGATMGNFHLDVDTSRVGTWVNDVITPWTDNVDLWQLQEATLPWVGGLDSVRFRIRLISTTSFTGDGGIDDIEVRQLIQNDIAPIATTQPQSGCTPADSLILCIRNEGAAAQLPGTMIHVSYSFNSGPSVVDSFALVDTLNSSDIVYYSFPQVPTYTVPGTDSIGFTATFAGDSAVSNDTIGIVYTFIQTIFATHPEIQDFDGGSFWTAGGTNSTWELGNPNKTVIQGTASGDSSWVSGGLTGDYVANENSYVESPCYDFTSFCDPKVAASVWWNSEFSWDGMNLTFSEDNQNYVLIGNFNDPNNWYTDNTINGNPGGYGEGWSGRNSTNNGSGGWVTAWRALDQIGNQAGIFRMNFGSDGSVQDDGTAFDDFAIFDGVMVLPRTAQNIACSPDSVMLTAIGQEAGDSLWWSTGDTNNVIWAHTTGWYQVWMMDSVCTFSDSVFVRIIDSLTTSEAGPDTMVCGNSYTLDAGMFPMSSFVWSNGDSTQTTTVTTSGVYTVMIMAPCDTIIDSVDVTILGEPVVNLGQDSAYCDMVMVDAGSGGVSYLWSTGDTTSMIQVTMSGNYSVVCTDSNGCTGDDDVDIIINASPVVALGSDQTICNGDTACFTAGSDTTYTYSWTGGQTTATACYTAAGSYTAVVTDTNGCSGMDTADVMIQAPPVAAFTADTSGCPNIVFTDASTDATSWSWDFGDGNMSTSQNPSNDYTAAGNGTYTVTLTATGTCGTDVSTLSITIDCLIGVEAPLAGDVSIYPNPSTGSFNVEITNMDAVSGSIEVLDMTGKQVVQRSWENANGSHVEAITLDNAASGFYFVRVTLDGQMATYRVAVK